MIDAASDAGVTVITICNYDIYQIGSQPSDAPLEVTRDAEATHDRRNKEQDKQGNKESLPDCDSKFDEFWAAYPKRRGANPKTPAKKKFLKAVDKGVDPDLIVRAAQRYTDELRAANKLETEFVAQALTWLNQERWTSEDAAPAAPREKRNFAAVDSDRWRAWDNYLRSQGKRAPEIDCRPYGPNGGVHRGFHFAAEWPPGHDRDPQAALPPAA